MADGAWSHTACIRADIHNLLAKEPVSPSRFNPFARRRPKRAAPAQPGAVEALARAMCGDAACDAKWGKQEAPTDGK